MKKATYKPYFLEFKEASGTSRGILTTKETYFLEITEGSKTGVGECALFRGLSYEDGPEYEEKLKWLCENINENKKMLRKELLYFPSIWFGYEQAMLNLAQGEDVYFPSDFTDGYSSIKINGLIWMGDAQFMQTQIESKLAEKFDCIKLKIGTNWEAEKEVIQQIRKEYTKDELEIRVDANGGFSFEEAKKVLKELSALDIHSIEQPIKAGNTKEMAELCANAPLPIALDEELIGILNFEDKKELLELIKPQYIILKPSLIGGFSGTDEWIKFAEELKIGWWITSALESNIGLNAIAQYTYTKNPKIPQGLGTGGLFTNNTDTRLILHGDELMRR